MTDNSINPYVGLRPFQADEDLLFFGRDTQILDLLERLHVHPFVAVIGSSGCGKSSLIRAGLIPALKGGYLLEDSSKWKIAKMKPGLSPMNRFAETMLRQLDIEPDEKTVSSLLLDIKKEGVEAILKRLAPLSKNHRYNFFLLVDQFEELFRFNMSSKKANHKTEAIDFVNTILQLTVQREIPFYVVLTMRSDFIGDCSEFHGLPEALNKNQFLVPRLNRQEMRRVVEGPAKLYGKKFSSALTSKILNDVTKVKDELPLLQHALMRIWDNHKDESSKKEIGLEYYRNIGGIQKALSNHADVALNDMSSKDKVLTEKIFKALTTIDENGRAIRHPILMSELVELTGESKEKLKEILDYFIRDKRSFVYLENTDNDNDQVIDISHESLIRQWNILRNWVIEEGESVSIYKSLVDAYLAHSVNKKDLLQGAELKLYSEWYNKTNPTIAWAKRHKSDFEETINYLNDSLSEQELNKIKIKKRKLIRIGLIAIGLIFGLFFLVKEVSRGIEAEQRSIVFSNYFEAERKLVNNPTEALKLQIEAWSKVEKNYEPEFRSKMELIFKKNAIYTSLLENNDSKSNANRIIFSPNGKKFISSGTTANLIKINGVSPSNSSSYSVNSKIKSSAISPDGKFYLAGFEDHSAILFNDKGEKISTFNHHQDDVSTVDFSSDGNSLLTASDDNVVYLYKRTTNENNSISYVKEDNEYREHTGRILYAKFTSDNSRILTGSYDGKAILRSIENDSIIGQYDSNDLISSITLRPNSNNIAAIGLLNGNTVLYDFENKKELQNFEPKSDSPSLKGISALSFSPENNYLVTSTFDGFISAINLEKNTTSLIHSHSSQIGVHCFKFLSDTDDKKGEILIHWLNGTLSFHALKENLLIDVSNKNDKYKALSSKDQFVTTVVVSDDKTKIFTSNTESIAKVYSTEIVDSILDIGNPKPWSIPASIKLPVFSFDGTKILLKSAIEGKVEIRTIDGTIKQEFKGHDSEVTALAFAPQGNLACVGYRDGFTVIWDINENKKSYSIIMDYGSKSAVTALAFSSNGQTLYQGFNNGRLVSIDLSPTDNSTSKLNLGSHYGAINQINVAPNDSRIVTASNDRTSVIWNLEENSEIRIPPQRNAITTASFSKDGSNIIIASDSIASQWNLKGEQIQVFKGHNKNIVSIAFTENDEQFLTGAADGSVYTWNMKKQFTFNKISSDLSDIRTLRLGTNDSTAILVSYVDRIAHELNLYNTEIKVIDFDFIDDLEENYSTQNGEPFAVFISPSGNQVIIQTEKDKASLYKSNGDFINTFNFDGQVSKVAYTIDNSRFVLGCSNGKSYVFASNKSDPLAFLDNNKSDISTVEILNNESNLLVLSSHPGREAYLWNGNNGTVIKEFNGLSMDEYGYCSAISPNELYVAIGTTKGRLYIWSVETGEFLYDPIDENDGQFIEDIEFSPDSKIIASSSSDKTIKLWDVSEGNLINSLSDGNSSISSVVFSSDGKKLVTGSLDSTLRIWDLSITISTLSQYIKLNYPTLHNNYSNDNNDK